MEIKNRDFDYYSDDSNINTANNSNNIPASSYYDDYSSQADKIAADADIYFDDPYVIKDDHINGTSKKDSSTKLTIDSYTPYVTYTLIVLNVLVFIMETIGGGSNDSDVLIKYGAQYAPLILNDGEWYRIFTAMFIHIGIMHIVGNMLCLFAIGQYIEVYFGRIEYTILYVLSGLAGNLLSLFFDMGKLDVAISAGASGAICGLFGALIILSLDKNTKTHFPLPRVIMAIILIFLPVKENVNVLAHIGGLIGGFVTAYTMYYYKKNK